MTTDIKGLSIRRAFEDLGSEIGKTRAQFTTGLRIINPGDDPSAQSLESSFKNRESAYNRGAFNLIESADVVDTASSAISEIEDIAYTISAYSELASNDATASALRSTLDTEVGALTDRLSQIVTEASYKGQTLLTGSYTNKRVQLGAESSNASQFSINNLTYITSSLASFDLTTSATASASVTLAETLYQQTLNESAAISATADNFVTQLNQVAVNTVVQSDALDNLLTVDKDETLVRLQGLTAKNLVAQEAYDKALRLPENDLTLINSLSVKKDGEIA